MMVVVVGRRNRRGAGDMVRSEQELDDMMRGRSRSLCRWVAGQPVHSYKRSVVLTCAVRLESRGTCLYVVVQGQATNAPPALVLLLIPSSTARRQHESTMGTDSHRRSYRDSRSRSPEARDHHHSSSHSHRERSHKSSSSRRDRDDDERDSRKVSKRRKERDESEGEEDKGPPAGVGLLEESDYFLKSSEFKVYLDEEKGKVRSWIYAGEQGLMGGRHRGWTC